MTVSLEYPLSFRTMWEGMCGGGETRLTGRAGISPERGCFPGGFLPAVEMTMG